MRYYKILSSKLIPKIKLIQNLDDESCKFLNNTYLNYKKICLQEDENMKKLMSIVESNNCCLSNDINEILLNNKNQNILVLCFTNNFTSRHKELYSFCKDNNINLLFVSSNNKLGQVPYTLYKNLNIVETVKKYNNAKLFFDFNIDSINIPYNWYLQLKSNFETILKRFDSYSLEEIQNNPSKISYDSIMCKKNQINMKDKDKFDIIDLIKKLKKYRTYCLKENNALGIVNENKQILANIFTSKLANSGYISIIEISELIKSLTYKNKAELESHIYDLLCDKLEKYISEYNYCLFCDNKCIAQRDELNDNDWPKNEYNGCCYNISKKVECKYLNCKSCEITCISCRLFTCKYLKDRGVDFDIRRNLQVKCFLNFFQVPELIWNFFTEKEKILKKVNNLDKFKSHM